MAARIPEQDEPTRAWVEPPLPDSLAVGDGTALVVSGGAMDASAMNLRLRVGRAEWPVETAPPPRRGHGGVRWQPRDGQGPADVCQSLSWWSIVDVLPPGRGEVSLPVSLLDGEEELPLGEIALVEGPSPADVRAPVIAICMATHEPDAERFLRQVESIRAQDRSDWACLISDDSSSAESLGRIERTLGGDPRFFLSRSDRRLGFYANFERALGMVPREATYVALADQDDRWDPDKLSALVAELDSHPSALLAYSDMRIATAAGEILSDTYWYLDQNACDDIASMAIVNTVTGAASLFRRELLDLALPFPPGSTAEHYHDHWLALCALAIGEIAYLDRPTYDYTRHGESVTLSNDRPWFAPPSGARGRLRIAWLQRTRRLRMGTTELGWRSVYLERVLLLRQYVAVLEIRAWPRIRPDKRRALRRLGEVGRSSRAVAWLLGRSLRTLRGRNETIGRERVLLGAVAWRWWSRRRSTRT